MKLGIRRGLFGLSVLICVTCWAFTFVSLALFGHPGAARWTAMVAVSAVATEVMIWTGVFVLGWKAFSNRRRFWARITRKSV